ncbi:Protein of unknown function [Propionibacterium freudenreichii]|nr:Protein of unknown function [Propionibacterium freudenreichii subsp. freudenreichii]CEG85691.1 Protein of unknown function [Propionibacterium freudenreichii]CEG88685.1 Protein of unknown function [Propionibacterium freudenreichii]CEG93106.1 Protein of unknown function [Propionibacterium freudenreichii]CEG96449.1 Protein of unknown function [Propionibacterium freudenreichii]
MTELADS